MVVDRWKYFGGNFSLFIVDIVQFFVSQVEVVQRDGSNMRMDSLRDHVDSLLRTETLYLSTSVKLVKFEGWPVLEDHVESVTVCRGEEDRGVHLPTATLAIRVFKLNRSGAEVEEISGGGEDEEVPAAQHWVLPNQEFQASGWCNGAMVEHGAWCYVGDWWWDGVMVGIGAWCYGGDWWMVLWWGLVHG